METIKVDKAALSTPLLTPSHMDGPGIKNKRKDTMGNIVANMPKVTDLNTETNSSILSGFISLLSIFHTSTITTIIQHP